MSPGLVAAGTSLGKAAGTAQPGSIVYETDSLQTHKRPSLFDCIVGY